MLRFNPLLGNVILGKKGEEKWKWSRGERRANTRWCITRLATASKQNITCSHSVCPERLHGTTVSWNTLLVDKGRSISSSCLQFLRGLQDISLPELLGWVTWDFWETPGKAGTLWAQSNRCTDMVVSSYQSALYVGVSLTIVGGAARLLKTAGKAWSYFRATPIGKQGRWQET